MITVIAGGVVAFRRLKSYFKAKRGIANLFAAAVCTLLCTSCSTTNGNASYKTSEEAVNAYATFLSTVKAKDNVSSSDLTALAKDWRTTHDSVTACLMRDTTMAIHGDWSRAYQTVHDSMRREFQRIVLSRPRTFADVVNLKATLSAYAEDEDLDAAKKAAMPFFASLDSVPIYKGGTNWSSLAYERMLDKTIASGFHSQADLLAFVRNEDVHFRTFLSHLSETENIAMGNITRKTERCCMLVFQAANRKELSHKDALVYLTMRTNRRLILNAQTCITDIKRGKIKSATQAQAYFWMLLQPYTSIDGVGMALLTENDRAALIKISADVPQCIGRLAKLTQMSEAQLKELPHLFMKVIVNSY